MLRRVRTWWNFRKALIKATKWGSTRVAGKKDVLVLPCWRRPEFLWHCLDNLTRSEGIDSVHVLLRPDTGYSPDNLDVIQEFADRLTSFEVQVADPSPFRRTKPSANLLLGCLHAAAAAKQYVFLVEEDIMVARDFLRWHRAVHAANDALFCSIGVKNPNRTVVLPDIPEGYYMSHGDYCSNGVCFDKQVLQTMLAPHVNMAYMRRAKNYIRRTFPASSIGLGFVEQDGLIRRIQEQSRLRIAWPCVARAFHSGFYGYNRPGGLEGSVEDRIRTLADTIYNPEAMRNAAGRVEFIETSMPCDLQPPEWNILRQIDIP